MATKKIKLWGHEVEIDAGMVKLVKALNRIPGLDTFSSCEGHENPTHASQSAWGRWYVNMNVDENAKGWRALERVAGVAGEFCGASGESFCRLTAWLNGDALSFELEGATAHCTADAFAAVLSKA